MHRDFQRWGAALAVFLAVWLLWSVLSAFAGGDMVNMSVVKTIESHSSPWAHNKTSGARGLYQITPICLRDYNERMWQNITEQELFVAEINDRIAWWYLHVGIPQMLRYYNLPVTVRNILLSYNAGINNLVRGWDLPHETREYLRQYERYTGEPI